MPKKTNKLAKEQIQERINYFTERVFYWQRTLGFLEVQVTVSWQNKEGVRASWYDNISGGAISIWYSKDWIKNPTVFLEDIDRTAFHEVYESQFYKMRHYLQERLSEEFIEELMHNITRRAENTIFLKLR